MGLLPKDAKILPPYDDRLFKVIMTEPKAEPVLKFVSSAIIGSSVKNVLVRTPELPVSNVNEKAQRFDVNCFITDEFENVLQADIEMQARHMQEEASSGHEILRARSIYYLCDLHAAQDSRGVEYNLLKRTYQVMFCAFPVFNGHSELIYRFSMRHDEENWLLHNAIQSVFVDLSKLDEIIKKPAERMTDMEMFSVFLRYADNPDYRDIVNKVIEKKEEIAVAAEVLMSVSKDEKEWAILRNRRVAQKDYESYLLTAKRIGRTEGRVEGRVEGERTKALSIAQNLLFTSLSIEEIARATGLTYKEIEDLRR